MSDEPLKFVLGDTAISAVTRQPGEKRWFFGRKRPPHAPLTHCENCGAPLSGIFCAQCGQPAIDYRRSFRHVLVDVLNEFLNWDSKFFATIGLLFVRPWKLTNEFLAGHRVRYLHPLRLYLLASIVFFFTVNYWAKSINFDSSKISAKDRTQLQAELKNENLPPEARAKIEKALKIKSAVPSLAAQETPKSRDSTAEARSETQKSSVKTSEGDDNPFVNFDNPPTDPFGKWLQARAKEKIGEHGTNAQLFLITLFSNLPYMMLCCVPLFALVLKILYIRKRIFYVDHLVYALHIHTFAYLSIILIVLSTMGLFRSVPGTLAGWIVGVLWFLFAVQIFLSIRRVYRQGWFFSIFKFFVGGFIYFFVLLMALATTFFITLAMP